MAAKYRFYTGGEAYCQPNIGYRTHQWQFRDDDSRFAGREVLVETPRREPGDTLFRTQSIALANGRGFTWLVDPDFRPVRLVDAAFAGLPEQVVPGQELRMRVRLANPYDYEVEIGGETELVMVWKHGRFEVEEIPTGVRCTIPARSETEAEATLRVPERLVGKEYAAGFALRREGRTHWFNGKPLRTEVLKP